MMDINVRLSVATVDFLCAINGKEVVLNSTIENDIGYLLIYPKTLSYVGAINDIIDDGDCDMIVGSVDVEIGFDENNPFKYQLGICTDDSSPIVLNNDLMFDLINEVMEYKGFVDCGNQDDFILSKTMLYQINNINAIINIDYNDDIGIENVEIIDPTASGNDEDIFVDWINNNYHSIINKMDSNKNIWQALLDDLKNKQAILCPQSAYELSQVKFEYDETYASLRKYHDKITIPKMDLHRLEQLVNGGIVMLNEIINVDFENGGNIGVFIESMAKDIPIDIEMVNISDNMIELDFKQYQDKV